MKFRTLKYHIRQGILGLFKNRLMSLAAIATVMACVFILIISLCIVENISYILDQFETKIGISVFISDQSSDRDVSFIEQKLKEISHVSEVKYISKEAALEWGRKNFNGKEFLSGLEEDNPFPRSFDLVIDSAENQRMVIEGIEKIQREFEEEIVSKKVEENFKKSISSTKVTEKNEADNSEKQETVSENMTIQSEVNNSSKDSDGVSLEEHKRAEISAIGNDGYEYMGIYKISAPQSAADSLAAIKNTVRIISFILIIVMGIISTSIIINTIKLTVLLRKNEINIMKYVGATDRFIRGPFIVEGLFIGIIGAIIPCIISWISYDELISIINQDVSVIKRLFEFSPSAEIFAFIAPISLLFGGGLGALGSITSVRRHLKV